MIAVAQRYGVVRGLGPSQPAWGWIAVDVIGVGSGVLDVLRRAGFKTIAFAGSEKATEEGPGGIGFANKRTESFWAVRTALEHGRLGLPDDPQWFDELVSLRWRPSATGGRIELESKDDWSARIGRSPDRADAVAMAMSAAGDADEARVFTRLAALSMVRQLW